MKLIYDPCSIQVRIRKQTLDGNVETLIPAVPEAMPGYGYAIVKELKKPAAGHIYRR